MRIYILNEVLKFLPTFLTFSTFLAFLEWGVPLLTFNFRSGLYVFTFLPFFFSKCCIIKKWWEKKKKRNPKVLYTLFFFSQTYSFPKIFLPHIASQLWKRDPQTVRDPPNLKTRFTCIDLQNDQFLVKQHCNETKGLSLQVQREASDSDFMDGRQPRKEVFGLSKLSCKVYWTHTAYVFVVVVLIVQFIWCFVHSDLWNCHQFFVPYRYESSKMNIYWKLLTIIKIIRI